MDKQFKQNDNNLAIAYYRFLSHSQNEGLHRPAETVRQSLLEDEHLTKAHFDRFLHADFGNVEVSDSVLEYFVDRIYLHESSLVVAL